MIRAVLVPVAPAPTMAMLDRSLRWVIMVVVVAFVAFVVLVVLVCSGGDPHIMSHSFLRNRYHRL